MSVPEEEVEVMSNGPGAAAILAAGIGCASVGILAVAGDASKPIGKFLNFYDPTGTLSGVTIMSIVIWLAVWFVLGSFWAGKTVALGRVNLAAFVLLFAGFLLTFPPFMDLLEGQ